MNVGTSLRSVRQINVRIPRYVFTIIVLRIRPGPGLFYISPILSFMVNSYVIDFARF